VTAENLFVEVVAGMVGRIQLLVVANMKKMVGALFVVALEPEGSRNYQRDSVAVA